ncbi:DUF4974 domain-containing protein [Fulvivirga sp. M361]|uniref:FecR domain-containing protein n=1 Tax=Fulvivirga sp. M361 TaxID=2594266 RepID=UPI00117B856E|nr:FecR domain-containing protein [Fulvivirga sp. M361]TRX61384.1 DUF4974 domain-containing protein [Fulvivirga sp. M361]
MKLFCWVICFFGVQCYCLSQQFEDRPLRDVIPDLEQRYNISFSFADQLIYDKRVSLSVELSRSEETILPLLEKQTHLKFERVDKSYIVIRPFTPADRIDICAYILSEDGQPLAGATVLAVQSGTGMVTNDSGYFEMEAVPYEEELSIHHLGYVNRRSKAREMFNVVCLGITLADSVSVLEGVVISDYMAVGISKRNQLLRIMPEELKVLPGLVEPDVLQSLQQAPGVSSPFETASGIFVRGGSPDFNLVRWNGIKTYSQGHFFGMLSAFNPYITKEVTFIKNGTSAKYGDRVSSVIDIESSEDVVEKISGGAGFNMIYGDAYVDIPLVRDKLSVQLSGRRSYNDYLETFTYHQFSDRVFQNTKIVQGSNADNQQADNNFFFNDYNTKVIFRPGKRDLFTMNMLYSKDDLDFASTDQDRRFNDILKTENEGYGLRWQHSAEKFQLDIDAYITRYQLNYEFQSTKNDTTDIASKKNRVRDNGFNVNAAFPLSKRSTFLSGYQFSHNRIQYAFENRTPLYNLVLDDDDAELTTHAIYAEYEFSTEKTRMVAGIRCNTYVDLDEVFIEPRLSVKQSMSDALHLTASMEYRSQTVSQIRESVVSDLSLENQVWTLSSDDNFPIIDSYQFTSGVLFDQKNWLIDAEAYLKRIDGITSLTFGFLNPVDNEYRIGASDIKGVDLFVKRQFNKYKTWLGYSYLFSENKFFGLNDNEPFPGNWNIEHTIKWSHFYDVGNLHLSLGWQWHTGKSFTNVTESDNSNGPLTIVYDEINEATLPVYHRLDLSAVYEFHLNKNQNVKYRAGISVFNLYDRQNLLNREFRTTPSLENELIDTRIYSLGITPNFVFRVFW